MVPMRSLRKPPDSPRSTTPDDFLWPNSGVGTCGVFWKQRVAFYWICGHGKSMLGLWEVGTAQRLSLHLAFQTDLRDLLDAPARLRAASIVPLDFEGEPTGEPVVLAWMPAASLYFRDPDGNLLELLSMLPDVPQPELGVISWSRWNQSRDQSRPPA